MKQYRKFLRRMIHRYVTGQSTEAEEDFLATLDRYQDRYSRSPFHELSAEEKRALQEEGWLAVQRRKDDSARIPRRRIVARRYAAVLLIGLAIGTLIYWYPRVSDRGEPVNGVTEISVWKDIEPEHGEATLRLPDGQVIALSAQQRGIKLGETLAYLDGSALDGIPVRANDETIALVMETPRGGNYRVTLSDGTRVWLNAASKLSYPSRFDLSQRIVHLDGEAYFEVTESDRPFLVNTSSQTVKVLGTSFNISAYTDDVHTTTTLLTGSVYLRDHQSARTEILAPGEQAILSNHRFGVRRVDVSGTVAWKDNMFSFHDTPLVEVLGQLRRWYDFELNDEPIPDLHFTGGIPRDVPLSHVLEMLESTTDAINFEIQGRKLLLKGVGQDRD